MSYTALLSFLRRLFSSTPADDIAEAISEGVTSSAPMSDQELSRTIKELRDSPVAGGAFRNGKASRKRNRDGDR